MEHKKIAFVANTSWYLYNFRLSLLKEMVANGWKVFAIAPQDKYSSLLLLSVANFSLISIRLRKSKDSGQSRCKNPRRIYRALQAIKGYHRS